MADISLGKMSVNKIVKFSGSQAITVKQWKAKEGDFVSVGAVLFTYTPCQDSPDDKKAKVELKFKSDAFGNLEKINAKAGEIVQPGSEIAQIGACQHPVVMKDLCAECGADLRSEDTQGSASVAMLHSIPELRVSKEQAETIGKRDVELLLQHRKLVLLVDLDQTLIHTTNDEIPANIKDVYHFQLYGSNSPWYHTRFRPGTQAFLENISKYYELHICTFGARLYAHTIARFLDPKGVYFSNRILSRDECFDQHSKTANLRALFPCGDNMVCIIDDREDVWNYVPNLIHVKPYHFFKHTGDINAPPGLEKAEQDDKEGFDFSTLETPQNDVQSEEAGSASAGVQRRDSMPNLTDDEDSDEKMLPEVAGAAVTKELNDDLSLSEDEEEMADSTASGSKKDADSEEKPTGKEDATSKQDQSSKDDTSSKETATRKEGADSGKDAVSKQGTESREAAIRKETADGKEGGGSEKGAANKNGAVSKKNADKAGTASKESTTSKEVTTTISDGTSPSAAEESAQVCRPAEKAAEVEPGGDGAESRPSGNAEPSQSGSTEPTQSGRSEPAAAASGAVNNGAVPDGKAPREIEVRDDDDYLLYLQDILMLIHRAFYSMLKKSDTGEPPDLRLLIPYVRKKVLKGVRLVFSGVVPSNVKLSSSRPYQVATNLGAVVQERLVRKGPRDELTTHLVAARLGTAKVNEALRSKRIQLVTLDWLWTCAERWERVDERLYPLSAETSVSRAPPAHCSSPDPEGERTRRQSFQETLNPLLTFSPDDIARMDEEVEDILQSGSDADDDEEPGPARPDTPPPRPDAPPPPPPGDSSDDSSEEEVAEPAAGGAAARGAKRPASDDESSEDESPSVKFRRGEPLPSDDDLGGDGNDSDEGGPDLEEDWSMMGAELERELGDE